MAVVILKGSEFKHSLNGSGLSAAIADIEAAIAVAKAMRHKIAVDAQQHVPGLPAIEEFLNSPHAKLACALEAAKKRPKQNRPTLEKVLAVPSLLNLSMPLPEIDRVRVKMKKKSGGLRFIHDFGTLHRSAKQMVLRVMEPIFNPQPFQYTFAGLPYIIGLVKAELSGGKVFNAALDINDHYGSFSTKKLAKLLPFLIEGWVDYVVGGRHAVVKIEKLTIPCWLSPSELLHLAQLGLPLGSICSSIIAAYSISHLEWTSGPTWVLLNYADNFLLLASSASVLEKKIVELTTAVGKLPGGKFTLKLEADGHASEGLTFLGHTLTVLDGKILTTVSPRSHDAICAACSKISGLLIEAIMSGKHEKALQYCKDYCAKVRGWTASFAACDDVAEIEEFLKIVLAQDASPLGKDVEALMQSVEGEYDYSSDEYQYV